MYQTGYYATGYYQTGYYGRGLAGVQTSLTYYSLLYEARFMLDDTVDLCYRYPDSMLVSILNRGLHELAVKRPDAFYELYSGNNLNIPEVTDQVPGPGQTDWLEVFPLDLRFYAPLLNFVVGMVQVSEDAYVEGGWQSAARAKLNAFRRQVLAV